jgi:hypothetical protein
MSDEQPTFKVTDRRLFNADGSLRDDLPPEEEKPVEAPAPAPAAATLSAAPEAAATAPAVESPAPASEPEPAADFLGEDPLPGEEDPASFINFVMSIASNAAAALGMMEHPVSGQRAVDLQLAHHWLNVLGMLQEKTKGNLHPTEQQALDGILADLRMQFVALTRAAAQQAKNPAGGAGGFTASDILGTK